MISGPFRALAVAVFFASISAPVLAQSTIAGRRDATHSALPPLPPPRPSQFAPAAQPPAASTPEEAPPDLPPTNHVELRARVHSCAMQWRSMKESGADLGTTWADFSSDCLAAK